MPWFTPASAMINVLSRKPEKRYSAQQKDGFFFPIYHSPRSADLSPPPVHMGPPPPYYRLYPPTMPQSQAVQEHRRSYSPPAELPPPPPPQPQQKQLMAPPPPPAPAPIIPAPPAPAPERRAISPPRHSVPPTPVPHVLRRRSSSIESLREDVSPVASPRRTLSRRHTLTTAPSALFESGPLSGPVPSIAIFPPTAGAARAVRFTENLICASPPPKRVGWFNRRGDQLWTNDGGFVEARRGDEYPPDLDCYPEPGAGWQNEQGVRIDTRHRTVPKAPLRSALKQRHTM